MSESNGPLRRLLHYFNFENDLEQADTIHDLIVKETEFKGTNLWILMFAIVVASVGLNMNSPAVIIGAMLISPLMGPINGIGYSIATYNFVLFRRSLKNLSFALIVGLLASTAYFALSPISTAYSELLARTSPTIYDVMIAMFGGLAGFVAMSSKQKGNVLPGVAIATALMPPLCTAGYGLATGQFEFFFGALYLFTINTVFIALATLIVSQLLKFPIRTNIEAKQKRKIKQGIYVVLFFILVPSIYFGFQLVKQERFNENAKKFISNVSVFEGNYLLNSEVTPTKKTIRLVYGETNLKKEQKNKIISSAQDFNLHEVSIIIEQGLSFDAFGKSTEVDQLKNEINKLSQKLSQNQVELNLIESKKKLGKDLLVELKTFYPSIISCSMAETFEYIGDQQQEVCLVRFESSFPLLPDEKRKIRTWLKERLHVEHLKVSIETQLLNLTSIKENGEN